MTEDAGDGVRTHVIGSEWDSINEILDSIKEASDGNPSNHYDHIDNATDLVNYVSNHLQTSDKTVQRVQEYFLNDKCPSCETENYEAAIAGDLDGERVDPTLRNIRGQSLRRASNTAWTRKFRRYSLRNAVTATKTHT